MKAFRLFDDLRARLRGARMMFLPNGPGSDDTWLQLGIEGSDFYGRINIKQVAWTALQRHCPNEAIDYATLETLCREPEHAATCIPALEAIAAAFCNYATAHRSLDPAEGAFYLLYATQTLAVEEKTLDMKTYSHEVAFGIYCREKALEE